MAPDHQIQHRAAFSVPPDHPALSGHFPGNPVVPGVVILDEVWRVAGHWLGDDLVMRRLPHAKFLSPLRPGEDATIELWREGSSVAFRVARGEATIARGALEMEPVNAP
jgi:3-hydroxymyristoyl/3-hydroxydecanoyl-(acyl carrier protein) dehydratase